MSRPRNPTEGPRRPLGRPIQDRSPVASHSGPDNCPRPPELTSSAAQRGELDARRARIASINDNAEIVDNNLDVNAREPERVLRRWMLARFRQVESLDPSPSTCYTDH